MACISTFILGGARSGKSVFAEKQAQLILGKKTYIATAQAYDEEMKARIRAHINRRGGEWDTVEAPLDLIRVYQDAVRNTDLILIDCITLWISNLMAQGRNIETNVIEFAGVVKQAKVRTLIVSNEVGQGIVPDNALARRFRDEAGIANQLIANACNEVAFIVAGLPLWLKKD